MLAGGGGLPEGVPAVETTNWRDVLTLRCWGPLHPPEVLPGRKPVGMMDTTDRLIVWQAPSSEEIAAAEAGGEPWMGVAVPQPE